jgi:DNA polymerase III gamma/tau subunit
MVVSTPQQAEVKLNNIVGEIQEVPNLPPRLLAKARELLQRGYGLLNLTEEQIDQRLDLLRTNDNNVNMDNIKAEIDRRANSVLPKLELAHIFQELFEMLYNAKYSPEERDPYDALHWYHSQIQEAMGGDDQRGFVSEQNLKQRKHEIPQMLAVVVDKTNNNRVYFGMPTDNKEVPNQHRLDNAYPRFKTLINECSNGRPNTSRPLTNCAEFEAYDKALWEREDNNSNSKQLFEGLEVIPAFGRSKIFGKVLYPCNNCQYLYARRT